MSIYGRLTSGLPPDVEEAAPGAVIGNFRLVECIAEGGMGVVWRAEQTTPIAREVAFKILKLGMDTARFVRRFHQEMETLARLEHPNIARIYDAGVTPRGRPFLVMELVRDAAPVTAWCRQHNLPLAERLNLFGVVCSAVQFAHQRGVIHRDLKPSNLLVGSGDGTPRPVVIDFGVAHAARDPGDGMILTEPGRLLGTPAYMSPEQVDAGEAAADTRSDIYSLGCVLYELITGQPPFEHERIRTSSLVELARILREEDPPAPSERLRASGDADGASRLRRELDWIVMKALARNPEQRYPSAAALEDDVRRFLRGDAVTARPSTALYRLRKFAARHKQATAATLAAVISLLAMTGVSLWQARREANERRNAEKILRFFDDNIVTAAHEAAESSGSADPFENAARRINEEFGDRPVLAARLRTTLSRARLKLGHNTQAAGDLEESLRVLTDELGAEHPETLRAAAGLAEWRLLAGSADESVKDWRRILPALRKSSDRREEKEAELGLARALAETGARSEAAELFAALLKAARDQPADREFASRAALAYGKMRAQAGDTALAEPLVGEAVALREAALGREHPDTLAAVGTLAGIEERLGKSAEALTLLRRVADGLRTALGGSHPRTIAAQKALADSCERLGDETTAISLSIAAGHALASSGRDAEAIASFLNASRLSQYHGLPEYADRFRVVAWDLSRRLGLPADGPHLPRSLAVEFPENGHWYQRFEVPMKWTEAEVACRGLGGHLATVSSEAENAFIYHNFASACACWLGGFRDGSGAWRWSTAEPFVWTHWAEGEPSNTDSQENFLNFGNSSLTFFRKGDAWNDHREAGDHAGWILTYPVCEWEPPAMPPAAPSPVEHALLLPRTSVRRFAGTGHWYARINLPMPFADAEAVCRALGGLPACVNTAEENAFLFEQFASDRLCWLGGSDREHEGEWKWASGEPFSYTNWTSGEPNNSEGAEHCMQFGLKADTGLRSFGSEWNDCSGDGTWLRRFLTHPVCEWDHEPALGGSP